MQNSPRPFVQPNRPGLDLFASISAIRVRKTFRFVGLVPFSGGRIGREDGEFYSFMDKTPVEALLLSLKLCAE